MLFHAIRTRATSENHRYLTVFLVHDVFNEITQNKNKNTTLYNQMCNQGYFKVQRCIKCRPATDVESLQSNSFTL